MLDSCLVPWLVWTVCNGSFVRNQVLWVVKMKLLGMEFAPLSIPMERRLQTFAVFFWISSFFFMGPMIFAFMVYLLFYTQYYWISLFYLAWYLGDRNTAESGGRRSLNFTVSLYIFADWFFTLSSKLRYRLGFFWILNNSLNSFLDSSR